MISAPPFVARAQGEFEAAAPGPAILRPDRQRARVAARRLGQRAADAAPPVARRIAIAGELEPVGVQAEAQIMRRAIAFMAPCDHVEGPPAGAVEPDDRPRPAPPPRPPPAPPPPGGAPGGRRCPSRSKS